MNDAVKYFQKNGLQRSKELVEMGFGFCSLEDDLSFHTEQLKRLVESHELVEKCGGLDSLKAWAKETKSKLSLATYFHCNKPPVLIQIENAEKAIADVESCMEVS